MVQINWTRKAANDLKEIYGFIANDSRKFAQLEVIKIKSRTRILERNPYAGKVVSEKGNERIRELIQGNYRIIYKIMNDSRVDILVVHHSARDLSQREVEK